ncbi:MAG: hypothetical protein LBL62_10680 [Planctomycetaceae bacterium]|nr:hypothetical protein [Planctomycetaceae bacterium]
MGNRSLNGCVGVLADNEPDLTTANCVAFRVGVNANSTGATAQRADCPPYGCPIFVGCLLLLVAYLCWSPTLCCPLLLG